VIYGPSEDIPKIRGLRWSYIKPQGGDHLQVWGLWHKLKRSWAGNVHYIQQIFYITKLAKENPFMLHVKLVSNLLMWGVMFFFQFSDGASMALSIWFPSNQMASRTANLYILWLWHIATLCVHKLWSPWQSKQENFMVKWMFMVISVTKMQTPSYRMISSFCLWLHYATTNKHKSMEMWIVQSWNENIATTIQNNSQQSNIMLINRYPSFLKGVLAQVKNHDKQFWKRNFMQPMKGSTCTHKWSNFVRFESKEGGGEGGEGRIFFVFTIVPNVGILFYE
jgi:hypothetical protein